MNKSKRNILTGLLMGLLMLSLAGTAYSASFYVPNTKTAITPKLATASANNACQDILDCLPPNKYIVMGNKFYAECSILGYRRACAAIGNNFPTLPSCEDGSAQVSQGFVFRTDDGEAFAQGGSRIAAGPVIPVDPYDPAAEPQETVGFPYVECIRVP